MTNISIKNFDQTSYDEIKKRNLSLTGTINKAVKIYLEGKPPSGGDLDPVLQRLDEIERRLERIDSSRSAPDPTPGRILDAIREFHDGGISPTAADIGAKIGLKSRFVGIYLSKMGIKSVHKSINGKDGRYILKN